MIKGIGIDISELTRFEKIIAKNDSFAEKILTEREFAIYAKLLGRAKIEFLAGRFSVKESFAKAFGTGIGSAISFKEIETLNDNQGKPVTTSPKFHGKIFTSISHSENYVISEIILEEN